MQRSRGDVLRLSATTMASEVNGMRDEINALTALLAAAKVELRDLTHDSVALQAEREMSRSTSTQLTDSLRITSTSLQVS